MESVYGVLCEALTTLPVMKDSWKFHGWYHERFMEGTRLTKGSRRCTKAHERFMEVHDGSRKVFMEARRLMETHERFLGVRRVTGRTKRSGKTNKKIFMKHSLCGLKPCKLTFISREQG